MANRCFNLFLALLVLSVIVFYFSQAQDGVGKVGGKARDQTKSQLRQQETLTENQKPTRRGRHGEGTKIDSTKRAGTTRKAAKGIVGSSSKKGLNPFKTSTFVNCSHFPVLHGGTTKEQFNYTHSFLSKQYSLHRPLKQELHVNRTRMGSPHPDKVVMSFVLRGQEGRSATAIKEVEVISNKGEVIHYGKSPSYTGSYIAVPPFISYNFAHFVSDNLPLLAWLKENGHLQGMNGLILEDQDLAKQMLQWIDPDLYDTVTWVPFDTKVTIKGKLHYLTLPTDYKGRVHNVELIGAFKTMIDRNADRIIKQAKLERKQQIRTLRKKGKIVEEGDHEQPVVIIYTRGGANDTSVKKRFIEAKHGRVVDRAHELDIAQMVEKTLMKYNRKETIVWFSGKDLQEPEEHMSYSQQFDLFRRATLVIGPHGGGLANLAWMGAGRPINGRSNSGRSSGGVTMAGNPSKTSQISQQQQQQEQDNESVLHSYCVNRPKVIEYLDGTGGQVQAGASFSKTFYNLLSGIPWLEYHHVLYATNSTEEATFINLNDLQQALDATLSNP